MLNILTTKMFCLKKVLQTLLRPSICLLRGCQPFTKEKWHSAGFYLNWKLHLLSSFLSRADLWNKLLRYSVGIKKTCGWQHIISLSFTKCRETMYKNKETYQHPECSHQWPHLKCAHFQFTSPVRFDFDLILLGGTYHRQKYQAFVTTNMPLKKRSTEAQLSSDTAGR